jgi:death-on-curing protein
MIRYLTLVEVLTLHRQIIQQSGGALGVLDLGALESALAQPRMKFGGEDLYPMLADKYLLQQNISWSDRLRHQRR